MNADLVCASAALASLLGLGHWAQAVPTRAWGDGAQAPSSPARPRTAGAAAGPAAGVALVLAAWMALGWLLVLGMNQWPRAARRWAVRLGALGCAGCAAALAVMWLHPAV